MDTNKVNDQKSIEKEIDLLELVKVLWDERKLILKLSSVGLLIGIIVASSIPKTYTTTVTLASEQTQSSGNMGTIAALTGISLLNSNSSSLSSPDLFPTILNSTSFLMGLLDIRVKNKDNSIDTTLCVYLEDYQKTPWWSSVIGMPSRILGLFSRNDNSTNLLLPVSNENNSYTILSKEELHVISSLKNMLDLKVDKKTNLINLSVTLQDPQISAYLTDTITKYLQEYVINYRTLKARQDLGFTQKLFDETKADFYKKQQELANYTDANIGVISAKYATTKDRLENEVALAYSMYNQMAQEFQKTKIKVQDNTPVYTVIEGSVEPLIPSAPNKKVIILGFVFLSCLMTCGYVLIKNYLTNIKK